MSPLLLPLLPLLSWLGMAALHDWKVAFAGPLTGPLAESAKESLDGVKAALAGAGQPAPFLEIDDGDEVKRAEAAFETLKSKKAELLIAAATGVTVDAYVAKARKAGLPLLLVGSCGPGGSSGPSVAPDDPVFWLGTSSVEQAIAISNFLDVPCRSKQAGLIVEETARGRELAAALERNLCGRMKLAATHFVAPHAAIADEAMAKLKAAAVDRLIVAGEPDLLDAVVNAQVSSSWKAPLLLADGMVSAAAKSLWGPTARDRLKGAFLLDGMPLCASEAGGATGASSGAERWRTRRAFATTQLFLRAAAKREVGSAKKPKLAELVAALCDVRYGEDESLRPIFDETHRSARQRWMPWKLGEQGPVADEPSLYLDPDFGPPLRVRPPSLYQAEPGTKVVWIHYGDATSKAVRSIESDLAALGLITGGYEAAMDRWIADELLARALGKLNKLFLKHEDGTFIPGVSFAISFTAEKPASLKESDYWRAVIAGDDAEAGGRAWPGEGRCEIYSTFMMRTIFQKDAMVPPLASEDRRFLDGRYVWGTSSPENLRLKKIRCLIDGYAGSFAMTGAHELGHICGLGHDEVERSIMNVVEGAGLRETAIQWAPQNLEVLERVLGRYGEKKRK